MEIVCLNIPIRSWKRTIFLIDKIIKDLPMQNTYRWEKAYIILIDFILPLPLTAIMWYAWYARTQSLYFASYVLLLGLCFGYIIPGIGTNVLRLWRFTGPFRIGNYFIHHGFMYAPYFALVLYVMFGQWQRMTAGQAVAISAGSGFVQSLLSSHHDSCGVKIGMIKINTRPARQGKCATEVICDWEPIGFLLFGSSYAAAPLNFASTNAALSRSAWCRFEPEKSVFAPHRITACERLALRA